MASFCKMPNGTWQATVSTGRGVNGKYGREYITRDSLKECKLAAYEMETLIDERKFSNMGKVRFSTWAEKWLELHRVNIAPSTYMAYGIYLKHHLIPHFGEMKLSQISDIHVKEYLVEKIADQSPTSVRKHFYVLQKILFDALKYKSPCVGIKPPQRVDFSPVSVSETMLKQLLEVAKPYEQIIILLAAWGGLRRGEIFALKWDDIDWKESRIRIDESRSISPDGYIDKGTKSKAGNRIIAIPDELLEQLREYRGASIKKGHIFAIRPDSWSSRFKTLVDDNGMVGMRFHDLRHYHATWLYHQGIPDQYAAMRLGHDVNVLKGIYQHLKVKKTNAVDRKIRRIKG